MVRMNQNKSITIRDLARMAGVSVATISRVLNDQQGVSEETRARIKQLIKETNFQPSAKARNFFRGDTKTIGLVIPRPDEYVFSNPFYLDILRGAVEASSKVKYNLLLVTSEKDSFTYLFYQQHVDGVIIISYPNNDYEIMKLIEEDLPFVLLSSLISNQPFNQIDIDDFAAAKKVIEYLIGLGHKRIAFIGCPVKVASGYYRLEGYRQALASAGISFNEDLVTYSEMPMSNVGAESVELILQKNPDTTAFFAFNDLVAIGAIGALREKGYMPGKDISVVGFDDIFSSQYTYPPLTTVRQSGFDKGWLAVERLLEVIKGDREKKRIILETSLIIRETCHKVN